MTRRPTDGQPVPGSAGRGATDAPPAAGQASGDREAPRRGRGTAARKGVLVLAVVFMFLTVGVPRWFSGDADRVAVDPDASFAKLCRDHGGTPASSPSTNGQRLCQVRYGGQVYVMDAITPGGFDDDTARYQEQGCEEQQRQQGASTAAGHRPQAFIYHPSTGVCEHRR